MRYFNIYCVLMPDDLQLQIAKAMGMNVVACDLGVAALKTACDLQGFRGGCVSRPLMDLNEA